MEAYLLLSLGMQLGWQGGIVLLLLLVPIVLLRFFPKIPRDFLFTIAALLTALAGGVSSQQLYQSCLNQALFAIVGLWLLGKAMQYQGIFQLILPSIAPVKKENILGYVLFFFQAVVIGAFLHHRYFLTAVLRPLLWNGEKKQDDLKVYGFPFLFLLMVGGLATVIGTPTNIALITAYSSIAGNISSQLFAFLPLAVLPILGTMIALYFLKERFRKPFPSFLEADSCAIVSPDSLLIGRKLSAPIYREGKVVSKSSPVECGDLILNSKVPHSQVLAFSHSIVIKRGWKKYLVGILFLAALIATFFAIPIGIAFLSAGVIAMLIRAFPWKTAFQNEFPLPVLLEVFSGFVFFYALQTSGLNAWLASLISLRFPLLIPPLFFICAQVLTHFLPRPIAFFTLFSVATALLFHPAQLLLIGINCAFAVAFPLFGKPLVDEIAIAYAMSGKPAWHWRALLLFVLFITTIVPTCFLWPR